MRDKATSFFFTNFPDSWDNGALWKMFSRYGKVVDVYVAFKRTKRDTRFGLLRFINIRDILSFESKLKGIKIGTERIINNHAKFIKVGDKGFSILEFHPINLGSRPLPIAPFKGSSSFKKAVAGSNMRSSPLFNFVKSILLEEDAGLKASCNIIFNHNGLKSNNDNDYPFEEEFVRPSVVVKNDGDRGVTTYTVTIILHHDRRPDELFLKR
nr:nucleotide-binding alpha-beta plait domain-containing protein [Tanacetum cinerariifolium]